MPVVTISNNILPEGLVATVADLSGRTSAQSIGDAGAGGFLALLNVAGVQANTTQGSGGLSSAMPDRQNSNNDQSAQAPPAVPMDAPVPPIAANNTTDGAPPAAPRGSDSANTNANNAGSATSNAASAAAGEGTGETPAQHQVSSRSPLQQSLQNPSAPVGQNNNQPVAAALSQAEGKLRDGLRQQLNAVSQVLMNVLQVMTGVAAPVAAAISTAPASPAFVILPGANAAVPPPAGVVSLLENMQSLVQQLQQTLQPADGRIPAQGQTQDHISATAGANLQQLIDALQTDNATLAQMLAQHTTGSASSNANAASLLSAVPQAALADNAGLLKDTIAQMRDQLQQLQSVNDRLFVQAKIDFQAQFAQTLASFGVAGNQNAAVNTEPASHVSLANGNENIATPVVPPVSVSPAADGLTTAVAGPFMTIGQGGAGSNSGGNAGNGNQNQPMPFVAGVGGQTAATGGIGGFSFARVLSQTASPGNLIDQVTFNIKTALADGSSKIHIQLDPVDLGKLDIRLNVGADGKTGVAITADNKSTLALLQRDAQGLTRALSDAGLSTDSGSLSFSLGGGQQNFTQGQPASQAAAVYQNTQPDAEDAAVPAISRSYVVNLAQGLDITI
ncbi:MAG: flagellar hook-length control protein FliK [Pseudomonadota bacterium]|nr:flagellar hook-length control protein FliK [Pseudomonadota bacterium]MDE3037462.1 flagellar hook-length control protein FliK [Pseudomonadota bacterium]